MNWACFGAPAVKPRYGQKTIAAYKVKGLQLFFPNAKQTAAK